MAVDRSLIVVCASVVILSKQKQEKTSIMY